MNPLETLKAIYDLLLQSESGFDMLVFLLILFGETAIPLLCFKKLERVRYYIFYGRY